MVKRVRKAFCRHGDKQVGPRSLIFAGDSSGASETLISDKKGENE